jgi:hypothetical protein
MKDRRAIWNRMNRFLAACTTQSEPDHVGVLLADGRHVDRSFFEDAHSLAVREFGIATRRLLVTGTIEEHEHAWMLQPEQIDDALMFMDRCPAIPEHLGRGLLVLGIETVFALRDPDTGQSLPGQGADLYGEQEADWNLLLGQSKLRLRLSERSTCALFLSLPFAEVTPAAQRLVASIQDALPFRLSPTNWARWQLNAQGTSYYKRRIKLDAGS